MKVEVILGIYGLYDVFTFSHFSFQRIIVSGLEKQTFLIIQL